MMMFLMMIVTKLVLQENNEKQEDRLAKATLELAGACLRADGAVCKKMQIRKCHKISTLYLLVHTCQ